MKRKRLLDSFALIAYLAKESGYEKVCDAMSEAQETSSSVLMNEINVGEVYYILYRRTGPQSAEYFINTVLVSLPILTVSNSLDDVLNAAKIKAKYPLAFADCFAVQTAQKYNAIVMTGDPEFEAVNHIVHIDWIEK